MGKARILAKDKQTPYERTLFQTRKWYGWKTIDVRYKNPEAAITDLNRQADRIAERLAL